MAYTKYDITYKKWKEWNPALENNLEDIYVKGFTFYDILEKVSFGSELYSFIDELLELIYEVIFFNIKKVRAEWGDVVHSFYVLWYHSDRKKIWCALKDNKYAMKTMYKHIGRIIENKHPRSKRNSPKWVEM